MPNQREAGGNLPLEVQDQQLRIELIRLGNDSRVLRYGQWNEANKQKKKAADAQIPENIVELLRRQSDKRLLDIQIDPNDLAQQLWVIIPPISEGPPPTHIFVNYTELEPIEPNIREMLKPYQKEFVRTRYSVRS